MNKRCDIIVAQWLVLIPCLISEQNSVAFNFCVMRSFRKFSTKVPKSGMNGKNFPLNDAQWKIFSKILHNVLWLCVCLPLAQGFNLPQMLMGQIAQNRCYRQ